MGELIAIVAIIMGCGIPMLVVWTRHQQKMADMHVSATAQNTAERAAQYASHVQELEDRVRVLERIVTDGGYDVATQIEALRDTRRVEEQSSGVPLGFAQREKVQ